MYYFILTLIFIAYFSLVEWLLHRYVMHKNIKWFDYPYIGHTRVHHHMFKADESYLVHKHEDPQAAKKKIPMEWWNGIVLVTLGSLPAIILSIIFSMWSITIISLIVGALYYAAYESMHWCMHAPAKRILEKLSFFRKLNGHHLLHHRYMNSNFNVVLPLWDLLCGTLLTRSKRPFMQAQDPSIPNVQPLNSE